jgi:hypothetical protein
MRRIMIAVAFILMAQGFAFGQTAGERRAWGYGFAGVGGRSNGNSDVLINAGGGGEGHFGTGFGLGGEVSYLAPSGNGSRSSIL